MHYEIKAHDVRCNGCGVDLSDATEMFYFSGDCAQEALELENWHTTADGSHYCRDCYKIDDEGKLVIAPAEGATFSPPKQAESPWNEINVSEDLPKKQGDYLAQSKHTGLVGTAYFKPDNEHRVGFWLACYCRWMEVPPLPRAEGGEV